MPKAYREGLYTHFVFMAHKTYGQREAVLEAMAKVPTFPFIHDITEERRCRMNDFAPMLCAAIWSSLSRTLALNAICFEREACILENSVVLALVGC
jgi:hypothetical protein